MWEFFSKQLDRFSEPLSYSIIVLSIIALVIIALKGTIKAKFGDKAIAVGGGANDDTKKIPASARDTVSLIKRKCSDCVLMLIGEREKTEVSMRKESDKILKTQMVFVEQKLIEIQTKLMALLSSEIRDSTKSGKEIDEVIQYKLLYGLLKDALVSIKDEMRRSFKDNGFYELNGTDFSAYVKNQQRTVISLLTQHIQNIYPDRIGVLSIMRITGVFDEHSYEISAIISDMYNRARDVKLEAEEKIDGIKQQFGDWVDKFIA